MESQYHLNAVNYTFCANPVNDVFDVRGFFVDLGLLYCAHLRNASSMIHFKASSLQSRRVVICALSFGKPFSGTELKSSLLISFPSHQCS
jgi:hypothetical protein